MHALVQHQINKPEKFLSIVQSGAKLPDGIELLAFLPAVSLESATCIWDAPDIDSIKNLIEPLLGDTSINTYHEIDESISLGLAKLKEHEMHA